MYTHALETDLWGQSSSYEKFVSLWCYHSYKVWIRSDFRQKDINKNAFLEIEVTFNDLWGHTWEKLIFAYS